jgi:N-acetylmuramoyl-L-alanine amidase
LSAAGELARAQSARAAFLQKASSQKRADWLALINQFEAAAKVQPKPEFAAKARILAAELAWLSYERFGQLADAQKTRLLARRANRDYPRGALAPGAQVLIGRALIAENKPDEAYRELMKVELNFPRSLETGAARSLLASLRRGGAPPPEPEKPAPQAARLEPNSPPKPTSPKNLPPGASLDKSAAPSALGAGADQAEARPKPRKVTLNPPARPKPRPDGLAQIYGLELADYGTYQEVIVYVDQVTPYVYNLAPPTGGGNFRIYADFKGAKLAPKLQERLNLNTPLVKLVKASQLTKDITRVVADIPQAYPYRPLFLENPNRLAIQVAQDGRDLPRPEVEAPPTPTPKAPPKEPTKTRPARGPANSLARQLGLKIRRVVIDPGHGGKDTGASGHGVKEKDVVLATGLLLAEKIRQRLGLEVILTRTTDKFVTLDRRSRLARENQADLFISIHANANSLAKVEGLETYILNFTDDRAALDTAARENAASDKSMSEMFNILEMIAKNTRVAESRVLAKALHAGALASLGQKYKVRDLGVKEAVFLVLVSVSVPSTLLEIGFVTNAKEAENLARPAYLELLTDGLVTGLKAYIDGLPKVNSK